MNVAHAVGSFAVTPGIAIVGLAGRFPGAASIEEFWCNLRDGVESISFLSDADLEAAGVEPQRRRDHRYIRAAAAIQGIDLFDAAFSRCLHVKRRSQIRSTDFFGMRLARAGRRGM